MKFEDLLEHYNSKIAFFNRIQKDNLIGKEYLEAYRDSCLDWFNNMKDFCDDFNPIIRKPTTKEKKLFNTDLIGIIDYRSDIIPVYDDDYGQCMYTKIDGETCSGGTYNLYVEKDFCYFYDTVKDFKINNMEDK